MLLPFMLATSSLGAQLPTWHDDVQAVVARSCLSCHVEGGSGPFSLETYETARDLRGEIALAVRDGRMPPWAPDETCRPMQGARQLTDEDRQTLLDWAEGTALEGTPAEVPESPPAPVTLTEPFLETAASGAYTPSDAGLDDYRCFLLEQTFEEQTWVTGYDILPDQTAVVHHAAVYLVPPAYVEQATELDAAQPEQLGWTCFGGPGLDFVEYFGGWVPGSGAVRFPDDSGTLIPAGSRVALQVHYHVDGVPPAPDHTRVRFSTTTDTPPWRVRQRPIVNTEFVIPAGAARSEHTTLHAQDGITTWTGVGVLPHMHLLGQEVSLQVVRPDGSRECLVRVPQWDFDWQETYFFAEPVEVTQEDQLELSCVFNNSAANQPVVDGQPIEPREVTWGDGSLDEMCVVVLTTLTPSDAVAGDTCVAPGDEGNELGVGRYCTDLDPTCPGEADFCLATAVAEHTYCTKTYCGSDDDCGTNATCEGNAAGSACIPTVCQDADDDDDDDACRCTATPSSGWPGPALALGALGAWALGRRRRVSSPMCPAAARSRRDDR